MGISLDPRKFLTKEDELRLELLDLGPRLGLKRQIDSVTFDPDIYRFIRRMAKKMGWTTSKTVSAMLLMVLDAYQEPENGGKTNAE